MIIFLPLSRGALEELSEEERHVPTPPRTTADAALLRAGITLLMWRLTSIVSVGTCVAVAVAVDVAVTGQTTEDQDGLAQLEANGFR